MDVQLTTTGDGFEFPVTAAVVGMDNGVSAAVLLSLFGGNDKGEWWGGTKTHTQRALKDRMPIPVNVKYIKAAVELDLAWLTSADIEVTMVSIEQISIRVNDIIINKNWSAESA